jgi:nitrogenase molybdenum-iron protein alpha/beta subunit
MSAPFGLSSSEAWFGSVADFFHVSHECIDLESKRVRMKCFPALSRIFGNNLRGAMFGVFGDSSQVVPLVAFLYEYIGMYPAIVGLREVGEKSYELLKKYVAVNSLDTSILVNPDQYEIIDCLNERAPALVFGSGIEEHLSMMLEEPPEFIPVSFPCYEKTLLTMRPLMGFTGVLTLVEDVINSIRHYQLTRKILPA